MGWWSSPPAYTACSAYVQSQSQASSLRQRGDEIQWILVISTLHELRSHMTANWERNSEIWLRKAIPYYRNNQPSVLSSTPKWSRKVQLCDLQKVSHHDLGSGQRYISMRNTYRTTSTSDHVTVGSSSAEIWPFEICVIWTFREVWTHVIALLEGNSKIGLWQPVE